MSADYFFGKSFGSGSTWSDLVKDLLCFLGSMIGGMIVYFVFVRFHLTPQAFTSSKEYLNIT